VRRPINDSLVLLLFFISGFSGLIYQVAWARLLEHVFGVTTFATSAVLGAYFGGLALGGWIGGAIADRRPGLRTYGLVEIALGVAALAVPGLLAALTEVYRWAHALAAEQMAALVAIRFLASFMALLVPTSLMGMALPILVRTLVARDDHLARQLPRLYGWNTFGSVLGALLTGYVFIGFFGLGWTMTIAVVLNLVAGGTAVRVARGEVRLADRRPREPASSRDDAIAGPIRGRQRVALAVTFCSGFAALGYEVAWFRVLAALSDHRAHTFSAVVAVVLLGIGIGSFTTGLLNRRREHPARMLAHVQLGLGSLGFLWLPLIVALSSVGAALAGGMTSSQGKADVPMVVALMVTLPPCMLMGIASPLAVQLYTEGREDLGRSVGWVYAFNLVGAMLGSVLTGFFVLPLLGAQHTLFALSTLNLVAAVLCLLPLPSRLSAGFALPMAGGAFIGVVLVSALAPRELFEALFSRAYPGTTILESYEDIEAAVTVARRGDRMSMYINGAHQANDDPEMIRLHRLLGLVPALIHPDLRDAVVIGMGGGATSGQIAALVKEHLTIVELSPSVVTAARAFARHNQDVVASPRTRVIIADGRNFLALNDDRYDLIAADTISPLHAHSGQLYSRDYYRLMASRLRERGLVLQWVDDSLKDHEQGIIMRTFVRAFPHVTMWQKDGRLLLGSNEPIAIDRAAMETRLTSEARDGLVQQGIASLDEFHDRLHAD
jgi:spermidine synthase